MGAAVLVFVLVGLGVLVLGAALTARLWTTLGMHRMAMHALHQELAERRIARRETRIQEGQYGTRASIISEPLHWDSDTERTRRPGDHG
jgi:hypothetical protein